MARGETRRPGYRRLNVAVPQRGDSAVPKVLTRFTAALNGMGTIRREADDLYQWRVIDDSQARAALALLRPWIGIVKRRQALRAIAAVDEQYVSGRIRARPGRRRPPIQVPFVLRSTLAPETRQRLDRVWAARPGTASGRRQHSMERSGYRHRCFVACAGSWVLDISSAMANRTTTRGWPKGSRRWSVYSKSSVRGSAPSNSSRRVTRSPRSSGRYGSRVEVRNASEATLMT